FEHYLRITDPFLEYLDEHKEEFHGNHTWGKPVVNNRFGFRDRNFDVPKPANVCRIMVLGDSFTWGSGLTPEERYTNLVETHLNQTFSDKEFEVVNFAEPGWPTVIERDILRDYKELVAPDLIVVGFVYSDTQPRSALYSIEREKFDKEYGDLINSISRSLTRIRFIQIAKITRKAIYNLAEQVGFFPHWSIALQRTYDNENTEWQEFRQALQDIKTMSDEMNLSSPLFVVLNDLIYLNYPTDYTNQDETLPLRLRWHHRAEQTAAEIGFTTFNYEYEFIDQLTLEEIPVTAFDAHPSAKVNRVYAEKLFDVIVSKITNRELCESVSHQEEQPTVAPPLLTRRLMSVRLGDDIRFLGYVVDNGDTENIQSTRQLFNRWQQDWVELPVSRHVDVKQERTVNLTFAWQPLREIDTSYNIVIHLSGDDGQQWLLADTLPCRGDCPSTNWSPGVIIAPGEFRNFWPANTVGLPSNIPFNEYRVTVSPQMPPGEYVMISDAFLDEYEIVIDPQIPSGRYDLVMAMYDTTTEERLSAFDEIFEIRLPEAQVVLGQIIIP
ncbi:hypothetical protein ACFLXQ_09535, partial [Chloroflexota bacterium]